MKKFFNITLLIAGLLFITNSCTKDLDTVPLDKDVVTSAFVFDDTDNYKAILAKLYGGLAVSGQQGPSGMPDISGIDEGFSQYLRAYWYHQELTTDEAVIGWNDQTIKDFHYQTWGSSDVFISAMYYRIFYQISLCNEYIRETTDGKLDGRGVSGELRTQVEQFRAEARFLRALSYWHALDLFGNVPFVTELDQVGAFFPQQKDQAFIFDYIEKELTAIEPLMVNARQNEYGRADKAAVWTLLAKLYLNSKIYVPDQDYNGYLTKCITNCNNVIAAGYDLEPEYKNLFLADNQNNNEVIFSINFDGNYTKTWGGMTFIMHAAVGGNMVPADYGLDGGWGGTRTTKGLVQKFFPDARTNLWSSPKPPKQTREYPLIYVPGSHQGWDPSNTTTVLASVNNDGKYEGYLDFPAATEFKFTYGPNWDVNFGDDGADGTLDQNGANILAADAGYYKINVDTTARTYTYVKTDWGIIGSATAGGWDSDQNMTYDPATGMWTALLDLVAGEMKFRANDDWAVNYGDTGADGKLEQDGANIVIPTSGTFTISLKLGVPDYTYTIVQSAYDRRAIFHTDGQNLEIEDISNFNDGYAVGKFKNVTRDGVPGSNLTFVDTDFPMFRLADVYLMYAEAVKRGGSGGDAGTALGYINEIRTRAYMGESGNINADQMTLDFILDERARELYWECHRRTDLIRFEKFTGGDYVWPWKGKVKDGTSTAEKFNLFPIPASDIGANPNLKQNDGY